MSNEATEYPRFTYFLWKEKHCDEQYMSGGRPLDENENDKLMDIINKNYKSFTTVSTNKSLLIEDFSFMFILGNSLQESCNKLDALLKTYPEDGYDLVIKDFGVAGKFSESEIQRCFGENRFLRRGMIPKHDVSVYFTRLNFKNK